MKEDADASQGLVQYASQMAHALVRGEVPDVGMHSEGAEKVKGLWPSAAQQAGQQGDSPCSVGRVSLQPVYLHCEGVLP